MTSGPFTLLTVMALVIATRLVRLVDAPVATRPPVAYTPLLTSTRSPSSDTSTAAWMVCFAVGHDRPSAASLPFVAT